MVVVIAAHKEVAGTVRLDAAELGDPTMAATHRARLDYLEARVAEIDRRLNAMSISTSRWLTVRWRVSSS